MGVLSDLVAGTDADIERIGRSRVPSREFSGIDIKGIDTIKLGTLQALLTGEDFDAVLPLYEPVYSVSEEGPWVTRLPPHFVSRLAALSSQEESVAAQQWAKTEEFTLDRWNQKEVAGVMRSIIALASKASSAGQSLYLWMCL